MMKLKDFFLGVCRFEVIAESAAAVLNLLMSARVVYGDLEADEADTNDGNETASCRVSFRCSLPAARRLSRLCAEKGIHNGYVTERGLPAAAIAAKRRLGLVLGAAAALLLIWLGESVIWGVEVVGADDVISAAEVRQLFSAAGVYPGAVIADINVDHSAAYAIAASDRLAWAAVNIRGTTAVIEVRSQVTADDEEDLFLEFDGVNLVAARDGLVVDLEIISGKPVVRRGNTVKKGELLVSGVIDSTRIGFRLTRSVGVVRAETLRTVSARVPYKYLKRVYSGKCKVDVWIDFFSKKIDVLRGYGSMDGEYDSVCSLFYPTLPGGAVLPVGMGYCRRLGYYYAEEERTVADAVKLCEFELSQLISRELGEGDYIVRRTVSTREADDGVVMDCEMVIAENIAVRQGFYFADGNESDENKQ